MSDNLLRLVALDAEDLAILSAHVQDAVLKIGDITRRGDAMIVALNRFVWEQAAIGSWRRREYMRRRSALRFARVGRMRSTGIDRAAVDTVLELLAVRFEETDAPSGDVILDFAGGATIRLSVEVLEVALTDLGPAWSTPHAPRHVLR